jgi:hypothetical protein
MHRPSGYLIVFVSLVTLRQIIPKQLKVNQQHVLIVQVIETLSRSSHIEPWAARAAGLVFAQYFWFRHCFLLTTHQGEAVQQLVVSMLSDRKLEVQDLAAASLSGGAHLHVAYFGYGYWQG